MTSVWIPQVEKKQCSGNIDKIRKLIITGQ